MTEQVPVWRTIFDAIDTELSDVTDQDGNPAFVDIIQGEPLGLPLGGPYCCFWYLGRVDSRAGRQTLGNIMYAARVQVAAYWPIQDRTTLASFEANIATVDTSIRRAFRANSIINSNLTDLDISDSDVSYGGFPTGTQQMYRALMFELRFDNLEGEPIAA